MLIPRPIGTRSSINNRTLVLHPDDDTTRFLKRAYEGIDCDVVTEFSSMTISDIRELMERYDRIVMLGHGTENGLIDRRRMTYVVDLTCVPVLKEKECVFVWCNANIFRDRYGLEGFATGMFISEWDEALSERVETSLVEIDESNELFSEVLGKALLEETDIRRMIDREYDGDNRCIKANRGYTLYEE